MARLREVAAFAAGFAGQIQASKLRGYLVVDLPEFAEGIGGAHAGRLVERAGIDAGAAFPRFFPLIG